MLFYVCMCDAYVTKNFRSHMFVFDENTDSIFIMVGLSSLKPDEHFPGPPVNSPRTINTPVAVVIGGVENVLTSPSPPSGKLITFDLQ